MEYLSASHLSWKCAEPALPLCFECKLLRCGPCFLELAYLILWVFSCLNQLHLFSLCPPSQQVCSVLSNLSVVVLVHAIILVVPAVLPGLLFVWVGNDFQWRQELHGFSTWMSLFGSQDPEKEQFEMLRILIEISDNFPRAWIRIVATSFRIWEKFCRLLLDHGGLTLSFLFLCCNLQFMTADKLLAGTPATLSPSVLNGKIGRLQEMLVLYSSTGLPSDSEVRMTLLGIRWNFWII